MMYTINMRQSRIPGRTAAINIFEIDSPVSAEYMISPTLGGKRMPRVPPAASKPIVVTRLYPLFSISGNAIELIAAATATLEPVMAAKIPQKTMEATPMPPGS
jgi:hypothetical protein